MEMVAYLEDLLDETSQSQVDAHLAQCSACTSELGKLRELTDRLTGETSRLPAVSLDRKVMDRLLYEQNLELRRLKMRQRVQTLRIGGALAAAAGLLFGLSIWQIRPSGNVMAAEAAEVLARGAEASPAVSSVHFVAQMRTYPADNMETIAVDGPLVPVEVWRQFGVHPKWRVEKPGRAFVMDGNSTTLLIKPDIVSKFPASEEGFGSGMLLELTKVRNLITTELRRALARGWDLHLAHETTAGGVKKVLVTVEAKSGVPANDFLENKIFDASNMRRVYRFDGRTQRLEGMEAYLHRTGGDLLVLKVEQIDYDKPIDASVFTLRLPEKVREFKAPVRLPDNARYEAMTPQEAAQAFLEACTKENWEEVEKFFRLLPLNEETKQNLGGLKIISLGTPFQSKTYPGWYIPYEIKFKDGHVQKHNLAMRKDNPAKRYVVDGGI